MFDVIDTYKYILWLQLSISRSENDNINNRICPGLTLSRHSQYVVLKHQKLGNK